MVGRACRMGYWMRGVQYGEGHRGEVTAAAANAQSPASRRRAWPGSALTPYFTGLPWSRGGPACSRQGAGDPETVFESASAPNESTTATSYQ